MTEGSRPVTDPFLRLLEHAASRVNMTKAQLLVDAAQGDEAYINASSERDMYEAAYDDLRKAALWAISALGHTSDRHATDARLKLETVVRGEQARD